MAVFIFEIDVIRGKKNRETLNQKQVFAIFLLLPMLLFSVVPLRTTSAISVLTWDSLQVGEVIAHGTPVTSSSPGSNPVCQFSNMISGVTTSNAGENRSIIFKVDSNCNVYVSSKSVTSHSYKPGDPSNNNVYMYDPIGLHLTSVTGTATFSICGSNICISKYVESYSVFPDGWILLGLSIDKVNFVGNPASGSGHGTFEWCNIGCSYQHSLFNSENISHNGNVISLVCFWSWNGYIVSGVGESCYFS